MGHKGGCGRTVTADPSGWLQSETFKFWVLNKKLFNLRLVLGGSMPGKQKAFNFTASGGSIAPFVSLRLIAPIHLTKNNGSKASPFQGDFSWFSTCDIIIYVRHGDVKCWYLRQNLREKNNSMSGSMKPFVLLVSSAILASDIGWITRRLDGMNWSLIVRLSPRSFLGRVCSTLWLDKLLLNELGLRLLGSTTTIKKLNQERRDSRALKSIKHMVL